MDFCGGARVCGLRAELVYAGGRMEGSDPALNPCYNEDGVDLSLIQWMLSLTPAERLQVLESFSNDILAIRELNAGK
jgi:hypothetical protein